MLTPRQKEFLAGSEDFQNFLASDPQLAALQADDEESIKLDWLNINEMLGGILQVGGLPVQPVTPAVWSFLWVTGNAYTRDIKTITELDTDIFLWVLAHGVRKITFELTELPVITSGTVEEAGLTYADAAAELMALVYHTFRPMSMLPGGCSTGEPPRYDAYWLAKLVSAVSRETGEPARDILFEMPLSSCLYYYIAGLPQSQSRLVWQRKPEEKLKEIGDYVDYLAETYCTIKGIE